jgi:hypothetical protein
MRLWRYSNGDEDSETTRFDLLFGYKCLRDNFAVRHYGREVG